MKNVIMIALVSICFSKVNAQNSMKDVFDGETKITFLGLDFTQAKFIGKEGFTDPYKVQTYYLQRWNEIIEEEYEKFRLEEVLRVKNYATSTGDLIGLNDDCNVEENLQNGSYSISEKEVQQSVRKYKIEEKDGIGVSYVVESFNKLEEKAVVWVTFINLKNNKVLFTERIEGKASGFGFRNYWLGAIYKINKMVNSRYRVWKRKFAK